MSGIFLTFDHWTHNLQPTSGGPPHATLVYSKNDIGFGITRNWLAAKNLDLVGKTLKLDRVICNTFFNEKLNRNRTDVLWCFDQHSSNLLLQEMTNVIRRMGYSEQQITKAVENRSNGVPFHVTLATDVDVVRGVYTEERIGKIVITGIYVD